MADRRVTDPQGRLMTPDATAREEQGKAYTWRRGDVFTNGTYRWRVASIDGDKAVLQSCSTAWATTRPLTFDEWREGGRWQLEVNHD